MADFLEELPPHELTPDQLALREAFVQRWIRIGLSTEPADRPRAERGLAALYRRAGFKAPRIVWMPCLMSAALAAGCHDRIRVLQRRDEFSSIAAVAEEAVNDQLSPAYGPQVRQAIEAAVCDALTRAGADRQKPTGDCHAVALEIGELSRNTLMWLEDDPWNEVLGAIHWPVAAAVRDPIGQRLFIFALRTTLVGYADVSVCCFDGALLDAGFYACQEFLQAVAGRAIDQDEFDVATSCGFVWMFDGVCFATERPSAIRRDAQGRLHSADAQSLAYAGTGWGLWTWHGQKIPADRAWLIEQAARITRDAILGEKHPDMRRVMCERISWPAAIERLGGVVLAAHEFAGRCRQLIEVPLPDGQGMRLLRVSFPDATDPVRRDYVEEVPGEITTLHAAEAHLFGIGPDHYREALRV